jgi:hypothetical protein
LPFVLLCSVSGAVVKKAFQAKYGATAKQPWKGLPAALAGCPYITVFTNAGGRAGHTNIQLDTAHLVRDAAAYTRTHK